MNKAVFNIFSFIFFISFLPAIAEDKFNDHIYPYWYGFGIGSLGTICALHELEHLTEKDVIALNNASTKNSSLIQDSLVRFFGFKWY